MVSETGLEKPTIKAFAHKGKEVKGEATYEAEINIPQDFGEVGAMFVENEHHKEMFLKDIVLDGFDTGKLKIICGSWVQPKSDKTQKKRVFFTAKVSVRFLFCLCLIPMYYVFFFFIIIICSFFFIHFICI